MSVALALSLSLSFMTDIDIQCKLNIHVQTDREAWRPLSLILKADSQSGAEINRVDLRCGQTSKAAAAPKSEGFAEPCLMLPDDH